MSNVLFFTKANCPLCDEAFDLVELLAEQYQLKVKVVDIYSDEDLLAEYQLKIPVVQIQGEELYGDRLTYEQLEQVIQSACSSHPLD